MPKVSFYLRNEDVEAWKAIDKKTQWISDNLNKSQYVGPDTFLLNPTKPTTLTKQDIDNAPKGEWNKEALKKILPTSTSMFDREQPKFCKHDAVLGMCKKNCK